MNETGEEMKRLVLLINYTILFATIIHSQSEWVVYKPNNSSLPSISIAALVIDSYNNIWIGSSLGSLTKFDGNDFTVFSEHGIAGSAISIAVGDGNNIWCGSQYAGLTKFDGTASTVFNTSNSELPSNEVRTIAVDNVGKLWVGTSAGVAIFYQDNWEVFNTSNSNLPHNWIYALAQDNDGVMWVGTAGGLVKTDGAGWLVFDQSNSDLPDNIILSIAIDSNNDKWIGTMSGGLAKLTAGGWTVFNQNNSGLPANRVNSIAIYGNNKWIGTTAGGVAKFDDTNWEVFNESNSLLPYNAVYAVAVEPNGNKWFGTYGGLAVYREGGVVSAEGDLESIPLNFTLEQNYPNPFNPTTTIEYAIPGNSFVKISIYDLRGREIKTIVNEMKQAGTDKAIFDGSNLSSGVYFYKIQAGTYEKIMKMLLLK